jgi:hypothetical protein
MVWFVFVHKSFGLAYPFWITENVTRAYERWLMQHCQCSKPALAGSVVPQISGYDRGTYAVEVSPKYGIPR